MKVGALFLTAAVMSALGIAQAPAPSSLPGTQSCVTLQRTLAQGSTGVDVSALQKMLDVSSTGFFGPATRQKLVAWQLSHGLIKLATAEGAGTTGPKTRAALTCRTAAATSTPPLKSTPPIAPKIVPPTSISSTSSATTSTQTTPSSSGVGTGGGGAAPVPAGQFSCSPLGPKPAANTCTTGTWQTVKDEGNCDVWDCSTPESDQG